jgi:hypothetical protein
MNANTETRTVPTAARALLALALVVFLIVQGKVLLGPGGIMSKYTFLQGFTAFGPLMLADPLTTAGLIDFIVLELVFFVILANGLPRGPAYPWLLAAFIAVSIVYPGLGALAFLFLYWRRLGQYRP